MQNFINPTTPLTDEEGYPLAGARVSFVDLQTSASLVEVYDYKGERRLPNPMILDACGRLPQTPYFKDGQSYKVVVEQPTGVEPVVGDDGIVLNESELWQDPFVWNVVAMNKPADGLDNESFANGIDGVRDTDTALGSVTCLGYASMDDGCPARVFTWHESNNPPADNGINILAGRGTGYWKMQEVGNELDVRIGGVFPNMLYDVTSTRLANLIQTYSATSQNNDLTFYFYGGRYNVCMDAIIPSMVMGSNASFHASGRNVRLTIGRLDNRGGRFTQNTADNYRVIPIVGNSVFKTSWLSGSLLPFVFDGSYTNIFKDCKVILLDNQRLEYGESSTASIDVEDKIVVNVVDKALPNYLSTKGAFDVFRGLAETDVVRCGDVILNEQGLSYMSEKLLGYDNNESIIELYKSVNMPDAGVDGTLEADKLKSRELKVTSLIKCDSNIITDSLNVTNELVKEVKIAGNDSTGLQCDGFKLRTDHIYVEHGGVDDTGLECHLASLFPNSSAGDVVWVNFTSWATSNTGYGKIKVFLTSSSHPIYANVFGFSMLPFYCTDSADSSHDPKFMPMFDAPINQD